MAKDIKPQSIYVRTVVQGMSPLLMHRFNEDSEASVSTTGGTRRAASRDETPREQAEKFAYQLPNKVLFLPTSAFLRLLREVGSNHKQKATRKSLKDLVPGAVTMLEERAMLVDPKMLPALSPITEFEVDSQRVVNQKTKGAHLAHRPRIERWAAVFEFRARVQILETETIQMLLQEGGETVGVGAFRPEKGGPFGTFRILSFQEFNDRQPSPWGDDEPIAQAAE